MSDRIVIAVRPVGLESTAHVHLEEVSGVAPAQDNLLAFECQPAAMPPLQGQGGVRDYGQRIYEGLCKHGIVKNALQGAPQVPLHQSRAIYFRLLVDGTDQLRWESLCDAAGNFLALDPRWPVGRIAPPQVSKQTTHVFTPPLRVMAVLGAAGMDARPEWKAIYQAAEAARADGLPTELTVLVGQTDLRMEIEARRNAGQVQNVSLAPIQPEEEGLLKAIRLARPHILHLFCHGHFGSGVAQFEFTNGIHEMAGGNGEQELTILRLHSLESLVARGPGDLWLAVLNCCEGARTEHRLPSMARTLAAFGVPAVVGMAEPIAVGDAHAFARGLYVPLMQSLAQRLGAAPPNTPVEIEWGQVLCDARNALCAPPKRKPDTDREWTLPVLYVRPEVFTAFRQSTVAGAPALPPEELERQRDLVKRVTGLLEAAGPDAPDYLRDPLLEILQQVSPELLPEEYRKPVPAAASGPVAAGNG
jgi:hypothetical protein